MIPKAELHVHLEGTATPELVRRLAERNGLPLPEGLFADEETYSYTDFLDFLRAYDLAAGVIRRGDDYRDLTFEYLARCAAEGAVYVELIALAGPRRPGGPERRRAPRRRWPRHRRRMRGARHRGAHARYRDPQLRRRAGDARGPLRGIAPAPVRGRLPAGWRRGRLPGG